MHPDVDQRTPTRSFLVGKPQTDSGGNSAGADPSGSRAVNLAQATFRDHVPSSANRSGKSELAPKKINPPALGGFVSQYLHLGCVHRRRLFAKDMFARFQSRQRSWEMQIVR